ncbi:Aryl carrier domain protein [Vibrio nigripulchritudo SFn118]|nr:Aryl carrier domain protein [Vibrio nigripulchritudo SFn118]
MILCTTNLNQTLEERRKLPKKKDIILSKQEANIDLLSTISQLLGVQTESIKPDVNLIELGLDSISMMRLTGQLRNAGLDINFAQLMENPTLESWEKLVFSDATSI